MSGPSVGYSGGSPGGGGYVALIVLAAASVSRDASSGALQMILARPIRRTDYLFGRYLGIVLAFLVFTVASVGIGLFVRAVVEVRVREVVSAHRDPLPAGRLAVLLVVLVRVARALGGLDEAELEARVLDGLPRDGPLVGRDVETALHRHCASVSLGRTSATFAHASASEHR